MKASISFNNIPKNVDNFAVLDISLFKNQLRFDDVFLSGSSAQYTSNSDHKCHRNHTSNPQQRSPLDDAEQVKDIVNVF